MTSKEIYAIIGWLAVRYDLNIDKLWKIEKYLSKLELSYDFIMRVLDDEVYGFYHDGIRDDYDFIYIDAETGRIGIWCEVDGFIAWLDEYNKKWRLENKEEKAERLKRKAEFEKHLKKSMKKFCVDIKKKKSVKFGKVKVKSIKTNGLGSYERNKNE